MLFGKLLAFLSKIFLFTGKVGLSKSFNFEKKLSTAEEKMYFDRLAKAKANHTTDTEAEEILTKHNLRLVAHIAKKYKSSYSDSDDLIMIGSVGLIKAVRTFNPEKAKNFSSYASVCIENEMLMVLRSEKKLSNEISMESSLGRDSDGNELTIMDTLCDERIDLERTADTNQSIEKIKATAKKLLDPREYKIIELRFGLNGSAPLTQREVASLLHISRSYISRIESASIDKLSKALINKIQINK